MDRAADRRADAAWLAAAWADPRTRVLVIDDGQALVRLRRRPAGAGAVPAGAGARGVRFLLGVDAAGVAYFGVDGPRSGLGAAARPGPGPAAPPEAGASGRAAPGRAAAQRPGRRADDPRGGAGQLACEHTHCPRCGAAREPVLAGHARRCPVDGSEHFPRLDPAVIMLVTDPATGACWPATRQWPPGRVSILAGFVEPGESAEQAVVREVARRPGIAGRAQVALPGQPAVADAAQPDARLRGARRGRAGDRVDEEEIAEARWFTRDELRPRRGHAGAALPPPVSIAHRIIESWYGAPLPGAW